MTHNAAITNKRLYGKNSNARHPDLREYRVRAKPTFFAPVSIFASIAGKCSSGKATHSRQPTINLFDIIHPVHPRSISNRLGRISFCKRRSSRICSMARRARARRGIQRNRLQSATASLDSAKPALFYFINRSIAVGR